MENIKDKFSDLKDPIWRGFLTLILGSLGIMNGSIINKSDDIKTEIGTIKTEVITIKADMNNYKEELKRANQRIDNVEFNAREDRKDMKDVIDKLQDKVYGRK